MTTSHQATGTPTRSRRARRAPALPLLLVPLLLLALPLSAALQEPEVVHVDADGNVQTVEKAQEAGQKEVKVHRVVLAPGDEKVRIVNLPDGQDGEDGTRRQMRMIVRTGEPGEAGSGEDAVKTWVWNGEDGEMVEGAPGSRVFFSQRVPRAFLGVQLTDVSPELRTHFGSREDRGVLVGHVVPDSPAARAGLRVGDLLTHLDGQPVESSFDVTTRLGDRKEGEVVAVEVIRDGKVETLSATLEVRERPQIDLAPFLHQFRSGEGKDWVFQVGEGATWEFDSEALERKLEGVRTFLDSDEWRREMENMEVELRQELESMEVELEELEKHLAELDVDVDVDLDFDAAGETEGADEP